MPYSLLKSYAKILEVDQEELVPKYFGLNHFGWFTDLKDKAGNDLFEKLRTYLRDHDFQRLMQSKEQNLGWTLM